MFGNEIDYYGKMRGVRRWIFESTSPTRLIQLLYDENDPTLSEYSSKPFKFQIQSSLSSWKLPKVTVVGEEDFGVD